MNEIRNLQAMTLAHDVLLSALIQTHPDPAALEAFVVRWRGMGGSEVTRQGLDDDPLKAAFDQHVKRFLAQIARAPGADQAPPE